MAEEKKTTSDDAVDETVTEAPAAAETPGGVDATAESAEAKPKPKPARSRAAKPKAEVAADAESEAKTEEPSARAPRGARAKKVEAPKRAKTKAERGAYVRTPASPSEPGSRKERRGVVTSDKGAKSITVRVDEMKRHRKYKKIMRRSIKLNAHDERNEAKIGDVVRIVECRPLSKTKRWRLVEIVEVAK